MFYVACKASLGMQDGRITNAQITSSGDFTGDSKCSKYNARLNTADKYHAWCAKSHQNLKSSNQYIEIDFDSVRNVTQVATQGRPGHNQYVTQYYLSFSNDSTTWFDYVGNEQCTVVCKFMDVLCEREVQICARFRAFRCWIIIK